MMRSTPLLVALLLTVSCGSPTAEADNEPQIVRVRVVDSSGTPVSGAVVSGETRLVDERGCHGPPQSQPFTGLTDFDGLFDTPPLAALGSSVCVALVVHPPENSLMRPFDGAVAYADLEPLGFKGSILVLQAEVVLGVTE